MQLSYFVKMSINGEWKIKPRFLENANFFSEDLAAVKEDNSDRYGYIDSNGYWVISPKFDLAYQFKNRRAVIRLDKKGFNYIDKKGKLLLSNFVEEAGSFENGRAIIKNQNTTSCIDTGGNVLFNIPVPFVSRYSEKLARIHDGQFGFLDMKGNFVIEPKFQDAKHFSNQYCAVMLNNKFGFIDYNGETKIPFLYENAKKFSEGVAAVKLDGYWGYIDKEGKWLIKPTYEIAMSFYGGLAEVHKNGDKWLINRNGEIIWSY